MLANVTEIKQTIEFAANALSDLIGRCPDTILGHVLDSSQLKSLLRDCVFHVEKAKGILQKCQVANVRGRLRFVLKKADVQAIIQDLNPVALWLCVNLSCVIVGLVQRFSKGVAAGGVTVDTGAEELLLLTQAFVGRGDIEEQLKSAMSSVAELMAADGFAKRKSSPKVDKDKPRREGSRGIRRRLSKSHHPQEALLRRSGKQGKSGYAWPFRRMSLTDRRTAPRSVSVEGLVDKKKDQKPPSSWSIRRIQTAPATTSQGPQTLPQPDTVPAEITPHRYVSLPTPDVTDSDTSTRKTGRLSPSMLRPPPAVPTPPTNSEINHQATFMSGALAAFGSKSSLGFQRNQLTRAGIDVSGTTQSSPMLFPSSKASSKSSRVRKGGAALAPSSGEVTTMDNSYSVITQTTHSSCTSAKPPPTLAATEQQSTADDDDADGHSEDFLDAFSRMTTQRDTLASNGEGEAGPKLNLTTCAPGAWIGLAGWFDASWAFLFFQREDGWVQLALLPDDSSRSAAILEPIIQVPLDSPMHCEVARGYHGRTVLRLFIFLKDEEQACSLVECRLDFGKGLENGKLPSWAMEKFEIQSSEAGGPQVEDLVAWDTGMSILLAASSSGGVVSVYERTSLTGNWESIPYPDKIPVEPGDYIFHTELPGSRKVRLRKLNQTGITQYEVDGYESWRDLHEEHPQRTPLNIHDKEVNWHGHPPKRLPGSCRVIHNHNGTVAGIFCQTAGDDIYLFRGHPWWNELHSPQFVCSVQEGSKFLVSESRRVLLFVSRENEMKRIDFSLDEEGEVTIETTGPVFFEHYFSTTLSDLLLKSPINDYLQYRPLYQSSSAYYYSTSSSSSSETQEVECADGDSAWSSLRTRSAEASRSWLGLPETESAPLLGTQGQA